MAFGSKCGHCGGAAFEVKAAEPAGSRYKHLFVQCSGCGVPVGVVDYYNLGALLKEQEAKIDRLETKLQDVTRHAQNTEHMLAQVARFLQERLR